ncbi:MAG: hypothetical protein ABSF23_00400 [Terracidiphilus sp.]|jgi:flagellar hook-associated protein 2
MGAVGLNFGSPLSGAGFDVSSTVAEIVAKLAQNSNSTIESTLNAEISKEQIYISARQSRLTAELTKANEILQVLPNELTGMNELYSAITGYNTTQR